jgi:hypothetical protein
MVFDDCKQAFGPGAIPSWRCLGVRNRNKVLGAGKDKHILAVVVDGDAVGSPADDPGDAVAPAKPEEPIPISCAIDEAKSGLEPVASWWKSNWDRVITRPHVEIRSELLSNTVKGASSVGVRDHVVGYA